MTDPYQRAYDAIYRWRGTATELLHLMRVEDPASPVSAALDPGGGDHGDPTYAQAVDRDTSRLDRIARVLERSADDLTQRRAALQPRTLRPDKPCRCCRDPDRLATHSAVTSVERDGVRRTVTVGVCWWCWRFAQAHNHLCDDGTHSQRAPVRLCECGRECCPSGCPDLVGAGRSHLSDRCAKRRSDRTRRPA